MLFSLLVPILLVALHVWSLRRRRREPVRYSSLTVVRAANPTGPTWRRHVPVALFALGLAALGVASARPQAVVEVPLNRTSIILALDVSLSMCSTDVQPNRLAAAQEAARSFVSARDDGTRIGIVAFGATAELVVPPTDDTDDLVMAIDRFTTSLGTGIGNATLKSIDAISEINPDVAPALQDLSDDVDRAELEASDDFVPDIVVLLTDGANSQGVEPLIAAQQAFDRRVRVYTIGFGSDSIAEMICAPNQIGPGSFAPGFGGFRNGSPDLGGATLDELRPFLVIDEPTLQSMADLTGGEYFRAQDAEQLLQVFNELPSQVVLQDEQTEISVGFAVAGLLALLTAGAVAMLWRRT